MLSVDKFYDKARLLKRLHARSFKTEDGHWLWLGKMTRHGRGVMTVGGVNGKDIEVHRVSAYIHHGLNLKDPDSHALHKVPCVHKNCWNPDCLYVGSHADNMNDIRNLPNFRCGHPKIANNLVIRSNGRHRCLTCHRQYTKNSRARIRARKLNQPKQ